MGWLEKKVGFNKLSHVKLEANFDTKKYEACSFCASALDLEEFEKNAFVCKNCNKHKRIKAEQFLNLLSDDLSQCEYIGDNIYSNDPLGFYPDKKHNVDKSVICMKTSMCGLNVCLGIMDFGYMGGSMGLVCGERIALLAEQALESKNALILVLSSGGARMQEGIFSLWQMAKVQSIRASLASASIPYVAVLTDPTTGGVAASFGLRADYHIAEPKALIGFAGPRVIQAALNVKLPDGFQTSEYLKESGFIDAIVHRKELKNKLASVISKLGYYSCNYKSIISQDVSILFVIFIRNKSRKKG